jgi:hypothetical protein
MKEKLAEISDYIDDLEARLQKARMIYAEWQLKEAKLVKECVEQNDKIVRLIEALKKHEPLQAVEALLRGEKK